MRPSTTWKIGWLVDLKLTLTVKGQIAFQNETGDKPHAEVCRDT